MASTKASLNVASMFNALISPASRSICPTCALSRALRSPRRHTPHPPPRRQLRYASTLVSSTAINAKKNIPPRLKSLHASLEILKKDAQDYVNISRLQLALRSLESLQPVTRVAILGLRHTGAAKKLARLLLADVLGDAGEWEKQLEKLEAEDQRALLIRFGRAGNGPTSDSLITTLHVPSRNLETHNLEILVSSLNISAGLPTGPIDTAELRRTALVPTAEAPRTFSGGIEYIRYPVHRAIVLAEGLQGCLALGRYANLNLDAKSGIKSPLKLALNLPEMQRNIGSASHEMGEIVTLDLDSGVHAIDKFRESSQNGAVYERSWHQSGITQLSQWINDGFQSQPATSVTSLVEDLLLEASQHIETEIEAQVRQAKLLASEEERQPLGEALRIWAMRAHSELRDQLDEAFASRNWIKLAWWKLLWRVDDVTMILTELLQRNWLVDAEKGLIWLSGRGIGAGFESGPGHSQLTLKDSELEKDEKAAAQNITAASNTTMIVGNPDYPWPSTIPTARLGLQTSTVPSLQALAQNLLLQAISISSLTAALSGLIYVALPTASLYSCGAVAALGLVWSLRYMQRRWENARRIWERDVRESARVVLKNAEENFKIALQRKVDIEDDIVAQDRKKALLAIEQAKEHLNEVVRER